MWFNVGVSDVLGVGRLICELVPKCVCECKCGLMWE